MVSGNKNKMALLAPKLHQDGPRRESISTPLFLVSTRGPAPLGRCLPAPHFVRPHATRAA
jgi:hypothetical protein